MDELINELNVLKINVNNSECNDNLEECISRFAKTVLSVTWSHELVITDDDFKSEASEQTLTTINYLLDSIKQLCDQLIDDNNSDDNNNDYKSVKALLGIDLSECLLWRKGSILYAYCNCKLNNNQNITQDKESDEQIGEQFDDELKHKLLSYLIEGIQWFRLLLTQRQSTNELITDENVSNTLSLISDNIFSDNHLLSMMYLSEMCYWYKKYSDVWKSYLHLDFDLNECAKYYLNIYIKSVETCLKSVGWNCDKAKHLIKLF